MSSSEIPSPSFSIRFCLSAVPIVVLGLTFSAFLISPNEIKIAFMGNSMMFVNDMPRFFQALASDHEIYQNSCLHSSVSVSTLLKKGNGMFSKWSTENALNEDGFYDFGVCTIPQLLLGYDDNLTAQNENGYYLNDGKNPCFLNQDYFNYIKQTVQPVEWDYVIMNDNSKKPAFSKKRTVSIAILKAFYAPVLRQTGAIPILMATHGYDENGTEIDGLGTVSNFTNAVYYGYQQYAQVLEKNLPEAQKPRIAPTGLAFLYLYENNPDLWIKLFFTEDFFHPSPHGTYLMGCILYTTIFRKMPPRFWSDPETLWSRARKMNIGKSRYAMPFPTVEEIKELRYACRKVGIEGVLPETFDVTNWEDDDDYY